MYNKNCKCATNINSNTPQKKLFANLYLRSFSTLKSLLDFVTSFMQSSRSIANLQWRLLSYVTVRDRVNPKKVTKMFSSFICTIFVNNPNPMQYFQSSTIFIFFLFFPPTFLNLHSRKFSTHIFYTGLRVLSRRICLTTESFLRWCSFSSFSWP